MALITEAPEYGHKATPEEVWAILRENAAQMKAHKEEWQREAEVRQAEAEQRSLRWQKEFEQRQQEAEKRQKEAEEQAEKRRQEAEQRYEKRQQEAEQRQKEFDRQQQEAEERRKEFEKQAEKRRREIDKILKRNSKQMGELHNKFGKLAEHLVAPGIVKRFNELGYHFKRVGTKGSKVYGENGKVETEIDLLLENGDYIILVEVKVQPMMKDIPHHIRRMEIWREAMDCLNNPRIIRGAMAGAIFGEAEKKAAIEAGFYVIEQSGDTMKIDIPEDFVPGEW